MPEQETQFIKKSDYVWEMRPYGGMRVPAVVFASERMLDKMKADRTLKQLCNVASLPGIVRAAYVMPDGHEGYGFPIGGVAAFRDEEGIISPGGIGYDINCGVRLIKTNLMYKDVAQHLKPLINAIYDNCPSGVGSKGKVRLGPATLKSVLTEGVEWAIREGYGWERDLQYIEEGGRMADADPSKVSDMAISRGKPQLGTIGSGNHFIELQEVGQVLDEDVAKRFGLFQGQFVIMVHTGSRGLGHQVASDYIRIFNSYVSRNNIQVADRELVYAHVNSKEGQDYIKAMNCAVNFAFVNRQLLTHWVREAVGIILKQDPEELGMEVLYDVCHNIGKREEHLLEDGRRGYVWVHRKGATRAMPAGRPEVPAAYRDVGQPVIIPGSMGTASYVLVGTQDSAESFHSVCHGAGRVMSRHEAIREYPVSKVKEQLGAKGIYIRSAETEVISEEAPGAYKDIDDVIDSVVGAKLAKAVTRMVPHGVVKG
ncbi:MAG: RtcB family protein [Candidatus Micrarchaeia archaeon]